MAFDFGIPERLWRIPFPLSPHSRKTSAEFRHTVVAASAEVGIDGFSRAVLNVVCSLSLATVVLVLVELIYHTIHMKNNDFVLVPAL